MGKRELAFGSSYLRDEENMDAWGTLDIGAAAIVRDELGSSIRRARKLVSVNQVIGM